MGMSIEEHIAQLKKLKSFHNGSYGASINYALDIMSKYQKIKEILKDDTYYEEYGDNAEKFIVSAISEVADGNDD